MWVVYKGDLERTLQMQPPTLDTIDSNRYQVQVQVDKVTSHLIQPARNNIAERYDLQRFKSATDHLELIDSIQAANQDGVPLVERAEGGVRSRNPAQS